MTSKPSSVAHIWIPGPFASGFDYRLENEALFANVTPGQIVKIPFGPRQVLGVVESLRDHAQTNKPLKPVKNVLNLPPFDEAFRKFLSFVAQYTMTPIGILVKASLSDAHKAKEDLNFYQKAATPPTGLPTEIKLTKRQKDIWQSLPDATLSLADLAHHAKCTKKTLEKLIALGLLIEKDDLPMGKVFTEDDINRPTLSPAQKQIHDDILHAWQEKDFHVSVLDGVTGSGKTEIYFHLLEQKLAAEKTVLILLPEIALTHQIVGRFEKYFGFTPHLWHSHLTPAQRRKLWQDIASGQAKVIIGARSALLLPIPNLGLIVVDEEHDPSYKQEESFLYNARDMAVARGQFSKAPVILCSATPSLETQLNCTEGRYDHFALPVRYGEAALPEIHLIDMRKTKLPTGQWLSPILREKLTQNFEEGGQSLLFLNRRGYAPLLLCRHCGYRFQCKDCSAWMVVHKKIDILQCHHCGAREKIPDHCPNCEEEGSLVACGPGTERLTEEVQNLLPAARVQTLTSDHAQNKARLDTTLAAMNQGKIDILIGTQILAKGHDFPGLNLVGIVDADLGLAGGDLRAAERNFQLLQQVAGRAGRREKQGFVYLQSYEPNHPLMQALQNYDRAGFFKEEQDLRKIRSWPPFGRLASVIVSGPEQGPLLKVLQQIAAQAPRQKDIEILGPAPAILSRVRGQYRYRFLIKTSKQVKIQPVLQNWLGRINLPRNLKLTIDIDPQSFL